MKILWLPSCKLQICHVDFLNFTAIPTELLPGCSGRTATMSQVIIITSEYTEVTDVQVFLCKSAVYNLLSKNSSANGPILVKKEFSLTVLRGHISFRHIIPCSLFIDK